jgi:hypothetical protein
MLKTLVRSISAGTNDGIHTSIGHPYRQYQDVRLNQTVKRDTMFPKTPQLLCEDDTLVILDFSCYLSAIGYGEMNAREAFV